MGRPLNKKFFGNRNIGSTSTAADNRIGGQGITSTITWTGANDTAGFTHNSTTQVTLSTPQLPNGVRAAVTIRSVVGAFLTVAANTSAADTNTFTATGTAVATTATYTGLAQKAGGTTTGTGAVFTIVRTGGTNYNANTVVTVTTAGAGYAAADTIKIDGALIGGVTVTNDITLTVVGATAIAGRITGFTVTETGSGYTGAPTFTYTTGTGTATRITSNLSVDTGAVGSATNQENTILMTARLTGGAAGLVDIIKQVSTNRFKVTDGTRTGIVKLKSSVATAAGEGSVKFTDYAAGTYFATKITARKATVTRGTGTAFATGAAVKWNMSAAVAGDSLLVENA